MIKPFIFLNGGAQQQFTNIDLAPYFQLNNLLGINPQQYNQPLPDGSYKICWEVYDFLTGQRISDPNLGCARIFLLLNDPPFLNIPNRGDQLTDIQPINIVFQWTPRHANATNVSYEFEIRELWDTQMDPQAGFLASPPFHTETTFSTTLLYNISKPPLIPGKTYAWRVRAKSTTGLSENSVFRNNGYSEIFNFSFTNNCYPPTFSLAEPSNAGRVKISWQTHPDHNRYHVQYKKAAVADAEWFEVFSYNNQVQVSNLQDGVTYDFRVGGTCQELTDFNQAFSYGSINQFTMPTADETLSYSCGIVPEIEISNTNPLENISTNETFTAGDFPVTVKEIQGGNGTFSGKGYIVVPYLADTKIAVEFSRIKINTDYQLYHRIIKTTYDPTWGDVESVDEYIDKIKKDIEAIKDAIAEQEASGELSPEDAAAAAQEVTAAEAQLSDVKEEVDQKKEELKKEEAKKPKDEEKIADLKKEVAEGKDRLDEISTALNNVAEQLGVGTTSSEQQPSDGYFDGSYAFTDTTDAITRPDDNRILVTLPKDQERSSTFLNKDFTIDGKPYRIVITTDTSPTDKQQQAKELADTPEGTTLYYHYDFENNQLFYKINFNDNLFGAMPSSDLTALKDLHKTTIKKLVKNDVSTVGDALVKFTLAVNRVFAESIGNFRIPECSWNPSKQPCSENGFNLVVEPKDAGTIDGLLEEITGIPLLVSVIVNYKLDPVARHRIQKALNDFEFIKAVENWAESKVEQYSGSPYEIEYQFNKDFTAFASTFISGGVGTG